MVPPLPGFVRVSADGASFELDGVRWRVAGANCYYLLTRAADPATLPDALRALDDAAAAGLTVLRCWAFADGAEQWNALQPAPGRFDPCVFAALDRVLAEAARRGLRLLLCLTNYWPDYGGMRQYVAWARQQRGLLGEAAAGPASAVGCEPEAFYDEPLCQRMFQRFVRAVVTRVNSLTGVAYRDDPTILAWSLANEPQCRGDASCATIGRWAHEAAEFIKGLDPHHLVTLDSEGFLGPSTPGERCHNPYDCAFTGCDWWRDACTSPHLDFLSVHLYPDLWLPQGTADPAKAAWALAWLDAHLRLAAAARRPLLLSEWGKRAGGAADGGDGDGGRAAYCAALLAGAAQRMRRGAPLAGTLYWMLAAPSYGDFDGFTIYLSGPRRGRAAEALEVHAAYVAALNAEAEEAVAVAIGGGGGGGVQADGPPGVAAPTADRLVASPVPNPVLVQQRQQQALPPLPAPPPLHPHTTCTRFLCPCCFIS